VRLLSFDTSSQALSVAVLDNGLVLAEANLESESALKSDRQQSVSLLLPTIDNLVRQAGLDKKDLQAIVAGLGPGGFTGVRVAVVTGRTLAQALKLPLVGINSLEVSSFGAPSRACDGGAVIKEASKTHFFVAQYRRVDFDGELYDLEPVRKPVYITAEQLEIECREQPSLLWYAEEPAAARLGQWSEELQKRVRTIAPVNNIALCQAKIANVRLSLKALAGEDLLQSFPYQPVQPLYLRGASVTLKKGDVIERVEAH